MGNSRFAPLPRWMKWTCLALAILLSIVVALHLTGHTPHHHWTSHT